MVRDFDRVPLAERGKIGEMREDKTLTRIRKEIYTVFAAEQEAHVALAALEHDSEGIVAQWAEANGYAFTPTSDYTDPLQILERLLDTLPDDDSPVPSEEMTQEQTEVTSESTEEDQPTPPQEGFSLAGWMTFHLQTGWMTFQGKLPINTIELGYIVVSSGKKLYLLSDSYELFEVSQDEQHNESLRPVVIENTQKASGNRLFALKGRYRDTKDIQLSAMTRDTYYTHNSSYVREAFLHPFKANRGAWHKAPYQTDGGKNVQMVGHYHQLPILKREQDRIVQTARQMYQDPSLSSFEEVTKPSERIPFIQQQRQDLAGETAACQKIRKLIHKTYPFAPEKFR